MHSIRAKITLTTMAAILVCVLAIGSGSILSIKAEGDRNSTEMMRLLCQTSCDSIDKYLDSIEQSVDLVSRYAMADFDTLEPVKAGLIGSDEAGGMSEGRRAALDAYLAGHLHSVETLFSSVAGSTNGALAFYYRLSPAISEEQTGFLYTNINSPVMTKAPLTDLSAYAPDDVEHVGWYYIPQANGVPTWIDPYYNANLDIRMFSYVTPLYCGVFLGVIGMDVSYETLLSQIRGIRVFDTGYACPPSPCAASPRTTPATSMWPPHRASPSLTPEARYGRWTSRCSTTSMSVCSPAPRMVLSTASP